MKVLLDECVDASLATMFQLHFASTCLDMGWIGQRNGSLLRLAESEFDAFVTVDKGIAYQQNLTSYKLRFILLRCGSNRADVLQKVLPQLEDAVQDLQPGELRIIELSAD